MTTKKKLHGPIEKGDIKAVKELVDLGADVNEPDKNGVTPIYIAFHYDNEELIKYLISKGADINYCNRGGSLPDCFHRALWKNKTEWILHFLKNGVSPNATDYEGSNALQKLFAHQNYDVNTHKILLEAGCNPAVKNKFGHCALDYLKNFGIKELNDLYSKYVDNLEINPNVKDIRDRNGPSVLFETLGKGTAKALRILIEQNPEIELNKRDQGGYTALGLAILRKKKDSAKVLLEKGADPTIPMLDYDDDPTLLPLAMAEDWVARGILKFQEIVDLIKQILDKKNL